MSEKSRGTVPTGGFRRGAYLLHLDRSRAGALIVRHVVCVCLARPWCAFPRIVDRGTGVRPRLFVVDPGQICCRVIRQIRFGRRTTRFVRMKAVESDGGNV